MFAYFNNVPEMGRAMKYGNSPPMVAAPTHEQQATLDNLNSQLGTVEDFLKRRDAETAVAQQEWQRKAASGEPVYWAPARGLRGLFGFEADKEAAPQDGTVTFTPGRLGRAAVFDGKAYLDAGSAADFDIDEQFTLASWIYSDSVPDGSVMSRMADNPKGKGFSPSSEFSS